MEISWRDINLDNLSHGGYLALVEACDHSRRIIRKELPYGLEAPIVGAYGRRRMWWEGETLVIEAE